MVFSGGSPLSGRGGKGRGPLEVLVSRRVVLLRARHGGGVGRVLWSCRPRARLSTRRRLLQLRCGALRYVGGVRVVLLPALLWWLKVGGSVVGAPFGWRWWSDLRPGGSWPCSFIVQGSVAVRRTTPVFKASKLSPVVVSGWSGLVFSGDGGGEAVALGCVSPLCVIVLAYVLFFVLCMS